MKYCWENEVKIDFCFGHRLIENYVGPCFSNHGHSGVCIIKLRFDTLDNKGMGMDFKILKKELKEYCDSNFDHGFIANKKDLSMIEFLKKEKNKYFLVDGNPTMENIAKIVFDVFRLKYGELIKKVTLFESVNQSASYGEI